MCAWEGLVSLVLSFCPLFQEVRRFSWDGEGRASCLCCRVRFSQVHVSSFFLSPTKYQSNYRLLTEVQAQMCLRVAAGFIDVRSKCWSRSAALESSLSECQAAGVLTLG